MKQLSPTFELT